LFGFVHEDYEKVIPEIVPRIHIQRDPRFTIEENWDNVVVPAVQEAQQRGVIVTPLTVFNYNEIAGWYLCGWKRPPASYVYKPDLIEEFIMEYQI